MYYSFLLLIIKATYTTISLAICSLIIGTILAIFFCILSIINYKYITFISITISYILRSLPESLVLLFIYFSIYKLNFITINSFCCGVLALSLIYSSYASQTIIMSFKSISYDQWESGYALGMKNSTIFFSIILPQMWLHVLPGLGNQWLVLLKDTSLVSLISVNDIMLQTKNIINYTQKPFTWYILASSIYLVITLLSKTILYLLRRRLVLYYKK